MRTIVEDTRNKKGKNAHITKQLSNLGYKVVRNKLYVGDYSFLDNQTISIDTKQNLSEICQNVVQDHDRFVRECERAIDVGIKLIVLIVDERITDLSGVFSWWNPRLKYSKKAVKGKQLAKILYTMQEKYGVEFKFCKQDEVGKTILELLGGETNEV